MIANAPLPDAVDQLAPAVLVVDDDEGMRSLLRRMLELAGFAVITAAHRREALKRIRTRVIDVVITDMVMPEMDGVELTRALVAEYSCLPIIAISGAARLEQLFPSPSVSARRLAFKSRSVRWPSSGAHPVAGEPQAEGMVLR